MKNTISSFLENFFLLCLLSIQNSFQYSSPSHKKFPFAQLISKELPSQLSYHASLRLYYHNQQ